MLDGSIAYIIHFLFQAWEFLMNDVFNPIPVFGRFKEEIFLEFGAVKDIGPFVLIEHFFQLSHERNKQSGNRKKPRKYKGKGIAL